MSQEDVAYATEQWNIAAAQREKAFDKMGVLARQNQELQQGNRHLRTMNAALTKEINTLKLESASRRASQAEQVTPTQPEAGPTIETAQEVHEDIESPSTPSDTSEEPDLPQEAMTEATEAPRVDFHLALFLWNIDVSVSLERGRQ
uniref:WGS project CBMI000000000 data, contig CS3069_c004450 n=1 Tax=Fusarium clavum TaxID=2594811 RepID=A0A090N628_9HYPO|nr:unnamed protein product [Fusarium clavum]